MKKKRYLLLGVVFALLVFLGYLQFRTWRDFDWQRFRAQTASLNYVRIIAGIALIYSTYFLRALRWQVLLRPTKRVPASSLVSSMFIGFTGLALFGRPGELVRPYLIAHKHGLSLPSQIAVLAVERVFDIACFSILLVFDLFLFLPVRIVDPDLMAKLQPVGLAAIVLVLALVAGMFLLWRSGEPVAAWVQRRLGGSFPHVAKSISEKVRTFSDGLHTIHDLGSFAQIFLLSISIWLIIALAYVQVMHAYPAELHGMSVPEVLLVMSASIAGSTLQLPGVGGGSQLGTISVLEHVFHLPKELAASCGLMLWLVTFMAVIPVGLIWTRVEQISLRKTEEEAEEEAERESHH